MMDKMSDTRESVRNFVAVGRVLQTGDQEALGDILYTMSIKELVHTVTSAVHLALNGAMALAPNSDPDEVVAAYLAVLSDEAENL